MGNQLQAYFPSGINEPSNTQTKKSIIRPIKYGYSKPQAQFQSNQEQIVQIKFSNEVYEEKNKNINESVRLKFPQSKQQNEDKEQIVKKRFSDLDQQSAGTYRQSIKQHKSALSNSQYSTSELIKIHYGQTNQTPNPIITKSLQQNEQDFGKISINYIPVVSRMISFLSIILILSEEPFQQELASLDEAKVRKIITGKSRDIFKGQLNDSGHPHGFGMLVKQSGSVLIGKFQDGLLQGEAIFIYNNGSYFKGKMINSMTNDVQGQFHSSEMTYIGGFYNNSFHGNCQQLGDDYHFKGEYENNLRKRGVFSWGAIKSKNKQPSYIESCGQSRSQKKYLVTTDDQSPQQNLDIISQRDFQQIPQFNYIYEGQFDIHQLFTGKGKLKDPQGIYIGDFHRGMKHGKGQYLYESKIRYIGDYDNDQRCGYGVLMNFDDTKAYEGEWKNGLPNGNGCSYDLGGRKTEGVFIDGLPGKIAPEDSPL